jgi:hypothetical protein
MTAIVSTPQDHHQEIIEKLLKVKNVVYDIIGAYVTGSVRCTELKSFSSVHRS